MKKTKWTEINNKNTHPEISVREYIEYFFSKYNILSSCDLAILIHPLTNTKLSFIGFQGYISSRLTLLKKEGKIKKIGEKRWKWVKKPTKNSLINNINKRIKNGRISK